MIVSALPDTFDTIKYDSGNKSAMAMTYTHEIIDTQDTLPHTERRSRLLLGRIVSFHFLGGQKYDTGATR